MTTYTERPWTKLYREGCPADITPDYPTMLDLFNASLAREPGAVAINYFDGVCSPWPTWMRVPARSRRP